MGFCNELEKVFRENANREMAIPMENYMKNNFLYLGIKTDARRALMLQVYNNNKAEVKTHYREICWELFNKKEREFHICAIDLIQKEIKKNYQLEDQVLIEKLLVTHSWWDSVDTIAKYLLGGYLLQFPGELYAIIERFSNSENRWLNRSAIIFQLSYKEKTDFDLLKSECEKHKDSKEFFIQKAIGWALRDYSRFNPKGVLDFVNSTNLKPLSVREAIRNIK
ncbi:DNA alkylation repair protein [Flavobacterium sp.]|uniref:DNA alkylation repair protein n=1 Tax=Flavobacterium sp. TaxID=239 RepID=UPI0038D254C8